LYFDISISLYDNILSKGGGNYLAKGSITKRGNKYQITVDIGKDPLTGKRRRHYETFNTKKEAETALAEIVAKINKGQYVDETDQTIYEFLSEWLDINSIHLRPNTEYVYRNYLKLLKPHLPQIKAKDLTKRQAEALITNLLKHYKPSTVAVCKRLLSTAFNKGVEWEIIAKNPFKGLRIPQEKKEYTVWTPEQINEFLSAVREKCENSNGNWSYYTAFMIAVHTGMRKSEILALRWQNIDFENRLIYVKESIHELYNQGKKFVGQPKSKSSNRAIAISDDLIHELIRQYNRQLNAATKKGTELPHPPNDYVITTADFKPIHQRNLTRVMYNVIEENKLPRIRFHDLRHTHASLLLSNGISPKVIQERLGHSKIDITMNTYSHVFPSMQQEAADKIGRLLNMSAKMSASPNTTHNENPPNSTVSRFTVDR
jgi:integrase